MVSSGSPGGAEAVKNVEKWRVWSVAERCGCLVVRRTSSFCTFDSTI